jgi:LmbE family N-acetylglucosaminyl deacetylase
VTRRLAAVFAHPDDEAFGITGTIALHGDDPAFRFALVLATSGERGMIADPALATRETLGGVREWEARAGWHALGREPDRLEFLRYADGGLTALPAGELAGRIAAILAEERPDVVITFGPDGVTGHPDHVAVGQATTEAFHRIRAEGGDGFRALLHHRLRRGDVDRFSDELVRRGGEPIDQTAIFQPHGVPDELVDVVVDCSSVWRRKRAALDEHRTQAEDLRAFPPEPQPEILGTETFQQVWPERPPGAPTLRDVFAGIGAEPPR